MVSLLSISKSYLSDVLINEVANSFNENTEKVYTTTNIVLATLYAKIVERSNSKELDKVYREIISSNFSNLGYIKLEDIFRKNNNLLIQESQAVLSVIFTSEELKNIATLIAEVVTVKKENIVALFKMLLPIVIGSINKVYFNERLDKNGFVKLLNNQSVFLSNETIPEKLSDDFVTLYNLKSFDKTNTNVKPNNFSKANFKTIAVAAIAFLLISLVYYFLITKNKQPTPTIIATATKTTAQPTNSENTVVNLSYLYHPTKENVGSYIKDYEILGYFEERALKNGTTILLLSKGGVKGLLNHIENGVPISKKKWFNIYRISVNKDAGTIDVKKSDAQLNQLAEIMKAYPNISIKIGACTDNKGSAKENFEVSYTMAEATAKELIKRGINPNRLKFEGYGENYPTFDNDTEWAKLNNRITIRLTQK